MCKKLNSLIVICAASFLLTMQHCYAAPLGLPKNTAKIGYGIGAAYMSVDDPDGDTNNSLAVLPFNFIYTDWLVSDIRYWTELYYYQTTLDADDKNIGQDVESYGIRFSLQKSFRWTRSWSPWLGAGIDVSNASYTVRHTVDSDGYLIQAYPDREETNVSLLLNIVSEWSLQRDWTLGAKLEQSIPISADIIELSAIITILYRY
jgi:hypothetical protein